MTAAAAVDLPARLADWARALRLHHWPKGAFVLVGLLPTAAYLRPAAVASAVAAALLFQAAASAGYLVNDLLDARRDRLHPRKRLRPIAAGRIGPAAALSVAALLGAGSVALGALLSPTLGMILAGYLALTFTYSVALKHAVFVDITVIAAAFVLRAVAGVAVIEAELSPWFLAAIGCLALLLALGKRLGEARLLSDRDLAHRAVLRRYQAPGWVRALSAAAAATIAAYAIAASCSPTAIAHPWVLATIAPVFLGVWRYTRLAVAGVGGQPERLLARDPWLLAAALAWVALLAGAVLV